MYALRKRKTVGGVACEVRFIDDDDDEDDDDKA